MGTMIIINYEKGLVIVAQRMSKASYYGNLKSL